MKKIMVIFFVVSVFFAVQGSMSVAGGYDQKLIKVSLITEESFLPAIDVRIAIVKDFFKNEGIELRPHYAAEISQKVHLLASGSAQFITDIAGALILAGNHNIKLKIVYVSSMGTSYYLVAQPEFKTLDDLFSYKNKTGNRARIATNTLNTVTHRMLLQAFRDKGYSDQDILDSIEFKPVGGSGKRLTALIQKTVTGSRNVEASILMSPLNERVRFAGFSPVLKPSDFPSHPELGLVTTEDYLRNNPETVAKMIRAIHKALTWSVENFVEVKKELISWLEMDKQAQAANKLYEELHGVPPVPLMTAEGLVDMAYVSFTRNVNYSGVVDKVSVDNLMKWVLPDVNPAPKPEDFMDFTIAEKVIKELKK